MESLESRELMAGLVGDAGAEVFVNCRTDAGDDLQAALVGEQLADLERDRVDYEPPNIAPSPRTDVREAPAVDRVGIAPLPSPYPDPDKLDGRSDPIGIAPLPTPYPDPDKLDERSDPIGILPMPTPYPRPVDAVMRVGIAPLPTP